MKALEIARELVAVESTSNLSNLPVIEKVEERLTALGFTTERIDFDDPAGVPKRNVVARRGPGRGGMAYFAHTDVVPAARWFTDEYGPFTPTVVGDRLYGRGSCDMKGSLACMLAAAATVSDSELKHPLYITCTADEETGYGGAAQVARRSELFREMVAGGANGVVGEPTMLEVVHAHKGIYGFSATSRGEAAHSSTGLGKNANLAMIPFLAELRQIHDECESDPAWRDDRFEPPTITMNIGINDHNHAINVTAARSVCTVYFRPMPGQDPEVLMGRMRAAAGEHGLEFEPGCCAPPLHVEPDSTFIGEVLDLTGRTKPRTVSYGTDGAMFTELEKLVVLGPGDIAQAHTHDEWIALDQLERGTEIFTRLLRHWCT
jgi:acetylornithine deacetylase